MKQLPNTPNEMPGGLFADPRQIREWMMELMRFPNSAVTWKMDVRASNAIEEDVGEWHVEIMVAKKRITAQHPEIENALWFAITLATAAQEARWEERESVRIAALGKLTDEEKRLLGLNK